MDSFGEFFGRYSLDSGNAEANFVDGFFGLVRLDEQAVKGYGTYGFGLELGTEGQVASVSQQLRYPTLLPSVSVDNPRLLRVLFLLQLYELIKGPYAMNDHREAVFLGQGHFVAENRNLNVERASTKAVESGLAQRHYPIVL